MVSVWAFHIIFKILLGSEHRRCEDPIVFIVVIVCEIYLFYGFWVWAHKNELNSATYFKFFNWPLHTLSPSGMNVVWLMYQPETYKKVSWTLLFLLTTTTSLLFWLEYAVFPVFWHPYSDLDEPTHLKPGLLVGKTLKMTDSENFINHFINQHCHESTVKFSHEWKSCFNLYVHCPIWEYCSYQHLV